MCVLMFLVSGKEKKYRMIYVKRHYLKKRGNIHIYSLSVRANKGKKVRV